MNNIIYLMKKIDFKSYKELNRIKTTARNMKESILKYWQTKDKQDWNRMVSKNQNKIQRYKPKWDGKYLYWILL